MSAPDAPIVPVDQLEAIGPAEIGAHIDAWLTVVPDAAASYDGYVGLPGSAAGLRAGLRRLAGLFATTSPVQP